jgi:ligand-binding sensor domain-containing protein/signal transduction histidine kinase
LPFSGKLAKLCQVFGLPAYRNRMSRANFLLAALCFCGAAGAIDLRAAAGTDISQFSFDVWQVGQDLEENPVTSVVQSRDGYLWVGTYTGLLRYDGVSVTVFDSATTPGLLNSRVTSLYEDRDGVLWIGHESGELTRMSNGEFSPMGRTHGWLGGALEAINMDEAGDLWLLNDTGLLFRLRDGRVIGVPGGGSGSRKASLSRERNGKLWVTANGSVAILDQGELTPFKFDGTNNGANFFERVVPARDGGFWVMGNGRLRKWQEGRWTADLGDCPCERGFVTELMETRSGMLLAGTLRDGLYLLTAGSEPVHFSRKNGLSHDWIRSLCEDHEGNIWIGTGGGLDVLRPRKVKMLNAPDDWQGRAILSFVIRPEGDAWIGTEGAGLYHLQGDHWTSFTEASGLANLFVWSVLETRRHDLLVGTWGGGLMVKKGERFETTRVLSSITAPVVALYEGKPGEVWIGTTAGLYRYQEGELNWFAGKDQLVSPDVRAIAESPDGTLWFGMLGGGLGCLKGGALEQFRKTDGLSSDFVLALHAEADGTLWIGTSDNGLCRLKRGKFATISVPQGLLDSIISQIADDDAGNLWMGSHHGILRASKAELNRCADGDTKLIRCLNYGKAEGLASQKCSGGFQPGVCKTADGRLWFPTTRGLAIIDPGNFTTNAAPPPVVIEELIVDGQPVRFPGPATADRENAAASVLKIRPGKQRFELRYTGLSFAAPDKVRFRYKLEGLETEWQEAGTKRVAQYSYLPPGTYHFQVTACNNDDVWNTKGASLSFRVLPHVWQTWWFKIALAAAAAGAVAGATTSVMRLRLHRRLEQLERQRALERERARIARDIHDDLGASLTRITMLSQSVRSDLESEHRAGADVDKIYSTARELTRSMDEIVWAVNPQHDTLDSLVTYLGRFAQSYLSAAGIRCRLDVPMHLPGWALTSEIRHNLFLAFKEGLHNVVKHAGASEVRISMELLFNGFELAIADNGRGFDWNKVNMGAAPDADGVRLAAGNGVLNMRRRLQEVDGRCEWITAPSEGTRVKLVIVVQAQKPSTRG